MIAQTEQNHYRLLRQKLKRDWPLRYKIRSMRILAPNAQKILPMLSGGPKVKRSQLPKVAAVPVRSMTLMETNAQHNTCLKPNSSN